MPRSKNSSTLNSSEDVPQISSKKSTERKKALGLIESDDRMMTTKYSKNTFHVRSSQNSERFDLDTNILSEIEKNKKRLKNSRLREDAQRQKLKRSGLIHTETSSKTSNS